VEPGPAQPAVPEPNTGRAEAEHAADVAV